MTAGKGSELHYDPRLLTFEFLCNVMLRRPQVQLIRAFAAKAEAGHSVCQQMLMGEGKTTMITPLVVLLLADGTRLVCACMPSALLGMSRAVLAERFSSPVLPRPVLTFDFHRQVVATPNLLAKLNAARKGRAPVIAAPTSVKSVLLRRIELLLELRHLQTSRVQQSAETETQGWLRLPSWLSVASNPDDEIADCPVEFSAQEKVKADEVRVCGEVLDLFHGGVMLLDEVDMLLDPLRSELNWPLGRRLPLDMTGQSVRGRNGCRYTLPFDLLDAVFAAATGCAESTPARRDAQVALGALAQKVKQGRKSLSVQVAPHFVLLSRDFYLKEMLPHLADWVALFVDEHLEGALLLPDLRTLLRQGRPELHFQEILLNMSSHGRKVLNLALSWLHELLPYLLSKIHRVTYGLLTGHALEMAWGDVRTPLSRKLLAVPFVGKDTPSVSSEFSHPDVTIGFTILAYRLNGLRERDVRTLLKVLLEEMRAEGAVHFHRRAACQAYVTMIVRAGGKVRGFTEDGRWVGDLKDDEHHRRRADSLAKSPHPANSGVEDAVDRRNVWPLELLDINDPEQVQLVYDVLRYSPMAIRHLLEHNVFIAGTLDRNETQLTACGQELAGPQLFKQCLGFSGTPNDLLPKSMGRCIYAEGDDGKVLQVLSSTQHVSVVELGRWSPVQILDIVAKTRSSRGNRPKYHALIDSGALVTGMTNREVAEYLLENGLEGLDGVLFLDERDERVVLERDSRRVVELVPKATFAKAKVDLVKACRNMIDFLKEVDKYPCLYANQQVLRQAVQRYEDIWLPLLAKKDPQARLVPPLDVEWVWHCHMLCPKAYREDAMNITGLSEPPDHELMPRTGKEFTSAQSLTSKLWEKAGGGNYDITAALQNAPLQANYEGNASCKSKYDIVAAAERQMAFYYQVAVMPHYRDQYFLELAVERYLDRFLELKRRRPKDFWVPTYDVDCVWHAHQLHPHNYQEETTRLCGAMLPHDDSVNDRSEGSRLNNRWEETKAAWNQEFPNDSATTPGGMYRGLVTIAERQYREQQWSLLRTNGAAAQNITLEAPWGVTNGPEAGIPWVHRKDAAGGLYGLRRFSKLGDLCAQVVHGRAQQQSFSYLEVVANAEKSVPLVTAHAVESDQLPGEGQLSYRSKCPTLKAGQMAYLLRVAGEDVAVVVGEWVGFQLPVRGVPGTPGISGDRGTGRRGVAGTRGVKGKPGKPGQLQIRLFALRTASECKVTPTYFKRTAPAMYTTNLSDLHVPGCTENMVVDVATSSIQVRAQSTLPMAVAYGLSMSIAALHVTLQPRMTPLATSGAVMGVAPGSKKPLPASPEAGVSMYPPWTVEQRNFPMLTAAGGEISPTETVVGVPLGNDDGSVQRDDHAYADDDSYLFWGVGMLYVSDFGYAGPSSQFPIPESQADYAVNGIAGQAVFASPVSGQVLPTSAHDVQQLFNTRNEWTLLTSRLASGGLYGKLHQAQCGLVPDQRFSFYDHVHTTGMDVKQPLLCTAALTLSKDMTLRDYAQGAYRMRGIGRGQRIDLLVTPEVSALMNKSLSRVAQLSEEARSRSLADLKKKEAAGQQSQGEKGMQ
ncbi:GRDP1 [Symbiodinium sp. CCMP2456]|nr:GRDP1 [Symbiodinium sp. CCMP2456]